MDRKQKRIVTIVIPVYNSERYLHECINSIMKQSYRSLDIIVIDDGSNDNSVGICEQYIREDKRIRLIKNSHRGVSVARNAGICEAKGYYIMFVDSDDELEENAIQSLINEAEQNEAADIIAGGLVAKYKNGLVKSAASETIYYDIDDMFKREDIGGYSCGRLYKKHILKKNKITFPVGVEVLEDLVFNVRYLIVCNKAIFVPNCKYYYRMRKTSATNRKCFSEPLKAFDEIEKIYNPRSDWYYLYKTIFKHKMVGLKKEKHYRVLRLIKSRTIPFSRKIKSIVIIRATFIYCIYLRMKQWRFKEYD